MKSSTTNLFCKVFAAAILAVLLTACAPPATVPSASSNLTIDMRRMQSSLDQQEKSIQALSDQVADLESRLQRQSEKLEGLRQTAPASQPSYQGVGTPQQGGAIAELPGEGSPTEIYLQAFGDYASGRYQAAIHGFETFLQRFPNNSYASNAQFWLADCYFNQQQYSMAVVEFEKILNNYPSAPKNPDALYKMAIAHLQLGETDQARESISILSQRYPKSTAAQKAQELAIP